ncbi:MAG TPA: glycoside hydrolase family 127 protein [Clostridiales bacterium]|nr:glycoside hydrolase family 127 protein [Clostridiales bacterium]
MYEKIYSKLPLGQVLADGWLKVQLNMQAKGLTGNIESIWSDLGPDSGWLGGNGESWERGPYYCDGLVPLAFLLKDNVLLEKVEKWIGWTLQSKKADGFFGPGSNDDWWPRMVMLKALMQYYEAKPTPDILSLMSDYFQYQLNKIDDKPLTDWGKFRASENIDAILWLYEKTNKSNLLNLADKIFKQAFNWSDFFKDFPYEKPIGNYMNWQEVHEAHLPVNERTMRYPDYMKSHIVNVAMAVKYPALAMRLYNDQEQKEILKKGLEDLYKYHGVANGMFIGDEHLNGNNPSNGSELCAVVELMYSLEKVLEVIGDTFYADLLEKVTFNALPATIDKEFCSHQYLQQANQVLCTIAKRDWYNNLDDSNIFGLEPNFGCCTANMHQGWPKFVQNMWLKTNRGFAAMLYGPCTLITELNDRNKIKIHEKTNYPFEGNIDFNICMEAPETFELQLRIPGWCKTFSLFVNSSKVSYTIRDGFIHIERLWKDGDCVKLILDMPIIKSFWANNSVSIERGPLLFALDLEERKKLINRKPPFADWELYPHKKWNYRLLLNNMNVKENFNNLNIHDNKDEQSESSNPFKEKNKFVEIEVYAAPCEEWKIVRNSADLPPESPAAVDSDNCIKLRLVPYGSTMLRISQFPWGDIQ